MVSRRPTGSLMYDSHLVVQDLEPGRQASPAVTLRLYVPQPAEWEPAPTLIPEKHQIFSHSWCRAGPTPNQHRLNVSCFLNGTRETLICLYMTRLILLLQNIIFIYLYLTINVVYCWIALRYSTFRLKYIDIVRYRVFWLWGPHIFRNDDAFRNHTINSWIQTGIIDY